MHARLRFVMYSLQLLEETFYPADEGALPTELKCSLHSICLLHGRVLQALIHHGNWLLHQERIEFIEAWELGLAASELAEHHRWVLEVIAEIFDEDVFEACQIEAIFECRDEEDVRLWPQSQPVVNVPGTRVHNKALAPEFITDLISELAHVLVEHLQSLDLIKEEYALCVLDTCWLWFLRTGCFVVLTFHVVTLEGKATDYLKQDNLLTILWVRL